MNIFEILFYQPIYNVMVAFYHLLGNNLALSIIAIAVVSRAILIPLTIKQIKLAESNRDFSDKMKAIKKKYKNNKEKQTEEMMALQKEHLPAQLGGCLPMIFQFIIFINIYNVVRSMISNGAEGFNKIAYNFVPQIEGEISGDFILGLNMKTSPSGAESALPYLVLVIGVGLSQYFSTKILTGLRKKREEKATSKKKNDTKKKKNFEDPEDFGEIMQRSTQQVMLIFPFFLMFISYQLPAGLSIYLITSSLFVILQQLFMDRFIRSDKAAEENNKLNN